MYGSRSILSSASRTESRGPMYGTVRFGTESPLCSDPLCKDFFVCFYKCSIGISPCILNSLEDSCSESLWNISRRTFNAYYGMVYSSLILMRKIAEKEIDSKTEVSDTLDYIYRQLGRLRMLNQLPKNEISSDALENRRRDVKSAVMRYIAVNLSHQCNRLGLGGSHLILGS